MKGSIMQYMEKYDYENLVVCQHKEIGLKAFIAIHDTTIGPAVGGCRMWVYQKEEDAIEDALRLARGMTYKYAAAGVNLGGGKTVIVGDPLKDKNEWIFRVIGRFIDRLNGAYYTGVDVGTNLQDMEYIHCETEYVATLPEYLGGAGPISSYTAWGAVLGMKASLQTLYGNNSLKGKSVAVQGMGNVGRHVVGYLVEEGVTKVFISDINEERVKDVIDQYKQHADFQVVKPDAIYDVKCDIFSPCALGAILNRTNIDRLQCKIVSGSANNQLESDEDGDILVEKGILYAPDFIVNAGGTIYDTDRIIYGTHNHERAKKHVDLVYDNTLQVFKISKDNGVPTYRAAEILAEERIEKYKTIKVMS